MNEFIRELIGKKLNINSEDDYYSDCEIKNIYDGWILVEEDGENKYVNLRYVMEIEEVSECSTSYGKKGLFRRKNNKEEDF